MNFGFTPQEDMADHIQRQQTDMLHRGHQRAQRGRGRSSKGNGQPTVDHGIRDSHRVPQYKEISEMKFIRVWIDETMRTPSLIPVSRIINVYIGRKGWDTSVWVCVFDEENEPMNYVYEAFIADRSSKDKCEEASHHAYRSMDNLLASLNSPNMEASHDN